MNRARILFVVLLPILVLGCSGSEKKAQVDFGVITPDHKAQKTLTLQFSEEAQNDPGAYVQFQFVTKEGREFPRGRVHFTVDGKEHSLKFFARDYRGGAKEVPIGMEFGKDAGEEVYEGRFVISDASAGLRPNVSFGPGKAKLSVGDPSTGLSVRAEYLIPWPVWQKGAFSFVTIAIVFLLAWFGILKRMFFLKFDGGVVEILEPVQQEIKLGGLRALHLGGNPKGTQGRFSRLFSGVIDTQLNQTAIGVNIFPVKIRNKVWHKIMTDSSTAMEPIENTLYDFAEYKLIGSDNQSIKFIYKNNKHQQPG